MAEDKVGCSVSILICTLNRCDELRHSLAAALASVLQSGERSVQFVIVDNGSTDATRSTIEAWASSHSFSVETIFQPEKGLARARNAGLARAAGEIIIFTDDDCRMDSDFVQECLAAFQEDERPTIRGGRIELGDPRDLPITIKTLADPFRVRPDELPIGRVVGANMAFHRDVVQAVGLFDENFGAGAQYKAGEESEYFLRAQLANIPIVYDPTMVVRHFHGRRRMDDAKRLYRGYCFADGAIFAKHLRLRVVQRAIRRTLVRAARDIIAIVLRRPPSKTALFPREGLLRLSNQAQGFATYLWGMLLNPQR